MQLTSTIKTLLFAATCCLSLGVAAQNQQAMTLSLDEARQYALENNIAIKNADLDRQIASKQSLEVISTGLPKINADLQYKNSFELPVSIVPAGSFPGQTEDIETRFGTQHNVTLDFVLEQLIVDGRYFIGLKFNRANEAIKQKQFELSEADVKEEVTKAYYGCLVADEGMAILDSNLATISSLLKETKALYEEGFAEELDVDRLQLQLSNLESNQEKTKLQRELAYSVLKYQMGLSLDQEIVLSQTLEEFMEENPAADFTFNPTERTEYQMLEIQHELRGYDAQQVRANYYPSLYGFFGYGFNAQRQEFDIFDFDQPWFRNGYVGIQLNIPIFDGLEASAMYQQKKLDQLKIENQMTDFQSSANLEVENKKTTYLSTMEEFENQEKSLALAEKIYDKVKAKYDEGVGSSFELSEAETELNTTQQNYLNAMYNMLVAKVELERALGKY